MIPARNNPYAAHRIDALTYRLEGECWDVLLSQLSEMNFRAAIVGPYGSGKTCFLDGLSQRLESQGDTIIKVTLSTDSPTLTGRDWQLLRQATKTKAIVLIDGADLLPVWQWVVIKAISRRFMGLIIAGHNDLGLPVLRRCQTHVGLLLVLLQSLGQEISEVYAKSLFERHNGNIRDVFRDLYMVVSSNNDKPISAVISP